MRERSGGLLLSLAAMVITAAALAVPAAANEATITSEKQVTPRRIELTIDTPAFVAPTKVDIDLPVGYGDKPSRRWPVTYFTAGTQNRYNAFNDFLDGETLTADYPSIIVSPDANSGYWSDWYNDGTFGPPEYETFVIDQLIPLIDERFRTIADRSHRAIFGISMGGYGSMMLAARHPDLFVGAATLSGAVDSNIPLNGTVLSISSTFDGAPVDAIYGPRATQQVRWRGHNPTDLASNLDDLDLQVRTANGVLNPEIGEGAGANDAASCLVEGGVYNASVNFHEMLDALGVDHDWVDYGNGCHTVPNFKREVIDTLSTFKGLLADPPAPPATFDYRSIEPHFDIWGWHVDTGADRALEFMALSGGRNEMTFEGSGLTTVTTPALYRGLKSVDVNGTPTRPRADGRLRFEVDLGPAHTIQQYTPGAATTFKKRRVSFAPHALVRITRVKRTGPDLRVCARAVGGVVPRARLRAGRASVKLKIGAKTTCRTVRLRGRASKVTITGRDRFGHAVRAKAPAPA